LHALECQQSPRAAKIYIFDWGRSELNTEELHQHFSEEDRTLREGYWILWQRGMLRVIFDAIVDYHRMFGISVGSYPRFEGTIVIEVWDYDTLSPSSYMGCVTFPLQSTHGPRIFLLDCSGLHMPISLRLLEMAQWAVGKEEGAPAVLAEVSTTMLPQSSRMSQVIWHVTVHAVYNLPRMDVFGQTDPLVRVKIFSHGMHRTANAPVVYDDSNAVVNSRLDFGASKPQIVQSLYSFLGRVWGEPVDPGLFLAAAADDPTAEDSAEREANNFEIFLSQVRRFRHLARQLEHV